jgi:MFS transporter, SHS family, lactate transporter
MRPVGAVVFGLMADQFGRRIPLMLNVILYAVISVLCAACCLGSCRKATRSATCSRRSRSAHCIRTQDMYPTLLGTLGYAKSRIADITMLSMIGAVLGGLAFGYYSDKAGRRRAIMTASSCALIVVPFWIAGFSPLFTLMGVFLMQFFVQGAWGVIPAHINELSPGSLRGFFPGFAYQLGVLCASSIPYLESALGERFSYAQSMGGLVAAVIIGAFLVTFFGPEAHGVSFRKGRH